MITALYTASSGLVAQAIKQDIIANNIANAQTAGFKRGRLVTESFAAALEDRIASTNDADRPPYPDSPVRPMTVGAAEAVDSSEGPIHPTQNPLDFAIEGPGAFEVSYPSGKRLTRAGNFRVAPDGTLATLDGGQVMGQSGPIRLPDEPWQVAADGSVTSKSGAFDTIKIVGAKEDTTRLLQGHLEGANVNVITEMVSMIANVRSFEANQRIINSIDRTLDKLINEAGKV